MTFGIVMYFILGAILSARFMYSFEGNGKTYSARKMLLNFVIFMIYILSIPGVCQ